MAIGIHTSIWIILLLIGIIIPKLDITQITANIKPIEIFLTVFLIPIFYIIGLLIDQLCFTILKGTMKKIKGKVFTEISEEDLLKYSDEWIGKNSEVLYSEYRNKIMRARILASMIINWPLIGLSLVIFIIRQNLNLIPTIITCGIIVIISVLLTIFSCKVWKAYFERAYKFRKNACDVILNSPPPTV